MKLRTISIISLVFLLSGCQLTFYLQDRWGEDCIEGATDLDKELIFRQESLRKSYKAGTLDESDGLHIYSNLKYVIEVEDNLMYITFFGTDTVEDVYYDMIHWKEPFWTDVDPDIRVHAGFNRPFQDIAPGIRSEVESFLATSPVDPQVRILGHSAGGVQAVLCSFYLSREFTTLELDDIYCQTGGAPAPGNVAFANAFNNESRITHHRYINGSDMMPALLTEEMGFYHVGQAYRIGPEPDPLTTVTSLWISWHFISDYADSLR